jgi:hypothetical protein
MRAESIAVIEGEISANASPLEPELQDGWYAVIDPTSGNTYYENLELGETTWDPPYKAN